MRPNILTVTGLGLLLAACGNTGTVNRGLESVHQPVVQRTDYAIDLAAGPAGGLAAGEQERLEGWFRSIGLAFGDRVAVDDPAGSDTGRGDVAALLSRRGMALSAAAPVTAGTLVPGSVRVVVSRATASVPGCPDWSRRASPDFAGSTMSNYGCATNSALAAMVADPQDLVAGRDVTGPVDPASSSKAIRVYRDRQPTGVQGLKNEATRGGQ